MLGQPLVLLFSTADCLQSIKVILKESSHFTTWGSLFSNVENIPANKNKS